MGKKKEPNYLSVLDELLLIIDELGIDCISKCDKEITIILDGIKYFEIYHQFCENIVLEEDNYFIINIGKKEVRITNGK